jgi:hypothetical protein
MIRSKVYNEIKDRLKEGFEGVLKHVDLQKQQFRNPSENFPIPMPAALIEFKPVSWSNIDDGQIADQVISVYLYLDLVTESFDEAEQEENTLLLLNSQDKIYEVLQESSGDYHGSMICINDQVHEYGPGYICFKADFKTLIERSHAPITQTTARPEPQFNN